jgi:hypothetical protein
MEVRGEFSAELDIASSALGKKKRKSEKEKMTQNKGYNTIFTNEEWGRGGKR